MVAATLSPTVASIQTARSGYVYGAPSAVPLLSAAKAALVRVGMPSDIPSNATISSAIVTFTQGSADYVGAVTHRLQRNATNWKMSKATWDNAPAPTGSLVAVTKTSSAGLTLWAFDVTSDVQSYIAGTLLNYGWRLTTTSSSTVKVRGSSAASGQASLVITYLTPTDAPDSLSPDGNQAVSLAKPWLSFQVPPDTTAVNVQIDADAVSTYDFDSGDVLSTAGVLDTSTTSFAGLTAGGASLFWRARTKSDLGYSPFSAWAQMRRVAKPTVTITSPGATADDTTPPIIWTATGQVSWRVIITNARGVTVADSGHIVGTETTYTPPKAIAKEGQTATVEVRVWDAVDRVVSVGDPVYAFATKTWTMQGVGSVAGAATVTATSNGITPAVLITATRGTAPDSWSIIRDTKLIASGLTNPLSYEDWTADPNHVHVYKASPYTNGVGRSSASTPTATVTPTCQGIWLIDPELSPPAFVAVIWGVDSGTFDATELAIVHQPLGGPPVRRVSYRPPLSGAVTGELVDVGSYTADASIAALYDYKADDRDLQLVLGDISLLVRVGDILVSPTPDSDLDRHSTVSFSWWQQDDAPWM